jgi:hypothetical protein
MYTPEIGAGGRRSPEVLGLGHPAWQEGTRGRR